MPPRLALPPYARRCPSRRARNDSRIPGRSNTHPPRPGRPRPALLGLPTPALGLAPTSLPIRQVTTAHLTHALRQTLLDERYGHNTRRMQGRLRQQDGLSRLVQDIPTLAR